MGNLGEIGELEAVRRLTAMLGRHPRLRTGAGDDCAVTEMAGTGNDQVFTTDPVIENIHFLPGEEPARIGHKAAGRVLSDIAAMGAQPQWLLVNVVAPPEQELEDLVAVYAGMTALCNRFGATLIGGDLARGPVLELHLFGSGMLPSGTALLRSGARAGDCILVTGKLGNSAAGRHLDFTPRVEEGLFLRNTGWVTAMIDISDGLATDLRHLLVQSGVGALLEAEKIPAYGTLEQALFDGEDFELLFTVQPEHVEPLRRRWKERFKLPLSVIGTLTPGEHKLALRRNGRVERLQSSAYEHFSERSRPGDARLPGSA